MDNENKIIDSEEITEVLDEATEVVEEQTEEVTSAISEDADEALEAVEDESDDDDDEDEDDDEDDDDEAVKKTAKGGKSGMILAAVIVLALVAAIAITATVLLKPQETKEDGTSADSSETDSATEDYTSFDYSGELDENGFWKGVKSSEYVKLCDYEAIKVPASEVEITDDQIQEQIDSFLSSNTTTNQITDRAVADQDTVNIDYVGTIDGVEFDGGSTNGGGTSVTIGVTTYIDNFLEQLIGHMPGETFDVNVTFPEDYETVEEGETSALNGKDAVFNVTINYIEETVTPEFNDEFVAANLTADYGWTTAEEARNGVKDTLYQNALYSYVSNYIVENSEVSEVPESMLKYQKDAMLAYYAQSAQSYGMTLEDIVSAYGYESVDALVESQQETIESNAKRDLIIQAIAEETGVTVDDDYLATFFKEQYQIDDYTQYEEVYGHNYLVYATIGETVYNNLMDSAVVE